MPLPVSASERLPAQPANGRSASAAPSDVIAVVVEGTGFGHGRGMSQWGAYGWAVDHGRNWVQILDHYYGGTVNGSIGNAQIRVRLTALDGAGTVGLVSHGGGVTFGGVTRPSMQAVRNAAGTYDIYASTAVSCAVSSTLVVPDGPLAKGATGDAVPPQTSDAPATEDSATLMETQDIEWHCERPA